MMPCALDMAAICPSKSADCRRWAVTSVAIWTILNGLPSRPMIGLNDTSSQTSRPPLPTRLYWPVTCSPRCRLSHISLYSALSREAASANIAAGLPRISSDRVAEDPAEDLVGVDDGAVHRQFQHRLRQADGVGLSLVVGGELGNLATVLAEYRHGAGDGADLVLAIGTVDLELVVAGGDPVHVADHAPDTAGDLQGEEDAGGEGHDNGRQYHGERREQGAAQPGGMVIEHGGQRGGAAVPEGLAGLRLRLGGVHEAGDAYALRRGGRLEGGGDRFRLAHEMGRDVDEGADLLVEALDAAVGAVGLGDLQSGRGAVRSLLEKGDLRLQQPEIGNRDGAGPRHRTDLAGDRHAVPEYARDAVHEGLAEIVVVDLGVDGRDPNRWRWLP